MKTLGNNWFIEGMIDFEYKQYILLAYLDEVKKFYAQTKIYPVLGDLIAQYRNLKSYKESKQTMYEQFPQRIAELDLKQGEIHYEKLVTEDNTLQEIDSIVDYSLPIIQKYVEEGRHIYDIIDQKLSIHSVGLLPIYKNDGYFLLRIGNEPTIYAYQYSISFIQEATEKLNLIHTEYLTDFKLNLTTNFETIKLELIRNNKDLPNPATYAVESPLIVPMTETLLPITKRRLIHVVLKNL